MAISLGNALKSITYDEHWLKKTLIGGLISIFVIGGSCVMEGESFSVSIRLAALAIYLIFASLLTGFLASTATRKLNSDAVDMTEWNEPNIMLKGIKFLLSYFVYCIVICLLFALVATVLVIVASLVLGLIYYLINMLLHLDQQAAGILIGIVLATLLVVFGLYFVQFISVAMLCYYKNLRFHDIMALKKHFSIIRENQHAAWTFVGKCILYTLLFLLIILVACITVVGIVLLPFIYFVAYVVMIDLYVQFGKEIEIGRYLS